MFFSFKYLTGKIVAINSSNLLVVELTPKNTNGLPLPAEIIFRFIGTQICIRETQVSPEEFERLVHLIERLFYEKTQALPL